MESTWHKANLAGAALHPSNFILPFAESLNGQFGIQLWRGQRAATVFQGLKPAKGGQATQRHE
jgi:hypothetical protein